MTALTQTVVTCLLIFSQMMTDRFRVGSCGIGPAPHSAPRLSSTLRAPLYAAAPSTPPTRSRGAFAVRCAEGPRSRGN